MLEIMGFLIPGLAGAAFALVWWWSTRLAWGRAGRPRRPWWRRWGTALAAVLYPAYAFAVLWMLMANRGVLSGDPLGIPNLVWAMAIVSSLPTLALGALAAAAARYWALLIGAALAAVGAPAAFRIFEAGTHGPWYIQNEGLALVVSAAVGALVWLLCIGAGTLAWGVLARRKRRALSGAVCSACGYDLRGLQGEVCPECGMARENEKPVAG